MSYDPKTGAYYHSYPNKKYPIEILNSLCDMALGQMNFQQSITMSGLHDWFYREFAKKEYYDKYQSISFELIMSILRYDEFVLYDKQKCVYILTHSGVAFFNTDSYAERQERRNLERRLHQQQSDLNGIELALKPYTFWIAVFGTVLSIIAIAISLIYHN